jgi:hypothetical protein
MLPEKGGASTFTLFMADRLEAFGRPVSLNEWIDDVAATMPTAYATYCGQQYQAQIIRQRHSALPRECTMSVAPEGWHVEWFSIHNPDHVRSAVRHVMRQRIRFQRRNARTWFVEHEDGTFSRSAVHHPRVVANGKAHRWTPETREVSKAESDAAVRTASESGMRAVWEAASLTERGVMLRYLADKIPVERAVSNRVVRQGRLRDLDKLVGDDPEQVMALLEQLLGSAAPNGAG